MIDYKKFLQYAARVATYSDDPRTHIGAFIYDIDTNIILWSEANQLSKGYEGIEDNKYPIMLHAEQAALYGHLVHGIRCKHIGLCATAACCTECAKAIVVAGVEEVVTSRVALEAMTNWKEQIDKGHEILRRGGVNLVLVDHVGSDVLIGGKKVEI